MKQWLIAAMLCASFTAFGQDRSINDLMYLPDAYTFYTKLNFDMSTENTELKGVTAGDSRIETKDYKLDLGYVVRKNLSLEITLQHLSKSFLFEPDGAREVQTQSKGMANPIFRFKWRALEQSTDDVSVDIFPYVSIKTGDARDATATSDGNSITGNGYGVEANVGKKFDSHQFMGLIKINHTSTYESQSFTHDPQTRYELGGVYQKTLTKSFFGNVSLSRIHWNDYRDDNDDTNVAGDMFERYSSRDAWSLGLEGLITPTKDLALSLGYKHFIAGDYSSKNDQGSKTKYENITASTISMFVRYQF